MGAHAVENEDSDAVARLNQTVGAQGGDRFANHGAADPESIDESLFGRQLVPWAPRSTLDLAVKSFNDRFREPLARGGLNRCGHVLIPSRFESAGVGRSPGRWLRLDVL